MNCSICNRLEVRLGVDVALLEGRQSERQIARQFGLHASSVHRHKSRCVARALSVTKADREVVHSSTLVAEIKALAQEAERLKRLAEEKGDLKLAMAGLREIANLLRIRAQFCEGSALRIGRARNVQIAVVYQEKRRLDDGGNTSAVPDLPENAP